ncbi:PotD/PotF family extracellular solute-binding protein [Psittacicella hinzii]|uniref:ABC transporter substrate-binding protein n=1 Tax=Psittacicella hinzii TaxID=2028575 RepID=UPI001CA66BAD|nr:extracellular solute-binding protein [Psittacicella hinzii]
MKKLFLAKAFTAFGVSLFSLSNLNTAFANQDTPGKVLYVYNWTEYIPTDVLKQFTDETGIQVRYSTYESNEELYSKLKLVKGEGYDLIFPSSYYVNLLKDEGYLRKLDHSKIRMDNVLPELLKHEYDPNNEYSIPYTYGFTTLAVNTNMYDIKEVTSWKDLWKPQYNNITLLNDVLDNFSMGLLAYGYDPNNATDEQVEETFEHLKVLSNKVVQFNSDSPEVPYIEGQSGIGMIWTGSAFRAHLEGNSEIKVVYPKEGAILWIDNFAIPAKAKNVAGAYEFINFILRPDIALRIVEEMGFQTSNSKVKALMPTEWQNDPALFPPEEVYKKAIMNNIPTSRLEFFNNFWNRIKVE